MRAERLRSERIDDYIRTRIIVVAVFVFLDWPIVILMHTQTESSPIIDQSAVYTPTLYLKNAVIYIRDFRACILGVKSYNKYN